MKIVDRLKHAWNAFARDPTIPWNNGRGYSLRPDRVRFTKGNERTIITAITNKIALDVAAIDIRHIKLNKDGQYTEDMESGLNNCLTLEANIDQTNRAFIQDLVISMFDEGSVAAIPVDTNINPITASYDINTMRTGKILEWFPEKIRVRVYNDRTGEKEDIIVPKRNAAIIENPFFAVMNEPNSTMQRLIRKLALLDVADEAAGTGKLDLILQLPYSTKTPARQEQAERRRAEMEEQLSKSKYGVAYTDGTENVIQLNRSLDNNLLKQIEYLTNLLYSQLGMTSSILDGTADEQTMLNYYTRIIEPVISAICDEFKRKFLTKTARTQRQTIRYFRDPFKLVPVDKIADIADKFTRNEILSSNDLREIVGKKPSKDPSADELRNKNLNKSNEEIAQTQPNMEGETVDYENERL